MKTFSYSILVTKIFFPMPVFDESPILHNKIEVHLGKCDRYFTLGEAWKTGLGKTAIDDSFSGEKLILIKRDYNVVEADFSRVYKHQVEKLSISYRMIPLLGVILPHEPQTVIISGQGYEDVDGKCVYESPTYLMQISDWVRAGYASKFLSIWEQDKIQVYKVVDNDGNVLHDKVDTFFIWSILAEEAEQSLFVSTSPYKMLSNSFMSFEESIKQNYLTFKFPLQVRSIEALLGLKSGQGKFDFANRIMKIYIHEDFPFKLHKSVREIFVDIYQIRSACVHGKDYEEAIESFNFKDSEIQHLAFLYEYILESAAIQVMSKFFLRKDLICHTTSRGMIEQFWCRAETEVIRDLLG